MLTVLDLFSGIGGFSLGLERTCGFKTIGFCEIDPYCRAVLRKHWPDVICLEDISRVNTDDLRRIGPVDVICGGFPCQDISTAGKGAGLAGARSGLWREYFRLIGELRPHYAIVENVAALLGRGLGDILGDLASIGYDAEWHCIPASYLGAPHRRDRVWVVADPSISRWRQGRQERRRSREGASPPRERSGPADSGIPHTQDNSENGSGIRRGVSAGAWGIEPDVGRVAHGVPSRVDRLRALGNAIVPQIAEMIGHAILNAESQPTE